MKYALIYLQRSHFYGYLSLGACTQHKKNLDKTLTYYGGIKSKNAKHIIHSAVSQKGNAKPAVYISITFFPTFTGVGRIHTQT